MTDWRDDPNLKWQCPRCWRIHADWNAAIACNHLPVDGPPGFRPGTRKENRRHENL